MSTCCCQALLSWTVARSVVARSVVARSVVARSVVARSLIAGAVVLCAAVSSSNALAVANGIGTNQQGFIGQWAGSTGVAINYNQVLTATHIGGNIGSTFSMDGQTYTINTLTVGPGDLTLLEVNGELPGWHDIATTVAVGDALVMGGFGQTIVNDQPTGAWSGIKLERWGTNTVFRLEDDLVQTLYTNAGTQAQFTGNDSGGGMFIPNTDGTLSVVGIAFAIGAQQVNAANFGDLSASTDLTRPAAKTFLADNINVPLPGDAVEILAAPETVADFFDVLEAQRVLDAGSFAGDYNQDRTLDQADLNYILQLVP